MHWQNLSAIDWVVVAVISAALLSVIPIYRSDIRQRRQRSAAWQRVYFQEGGLIRVLISRWGRGAARLTDQRQRGDEQP